MRSPEAVQSQIQIHEQPHRPGRIRRVVMAGVTATGLALGLGVATAESASANPTCYGDYCTGKYPDATGCDQDVRTLTSKRVTAVSYDIGANSSDGLTASTRHVEVGTLEVRGSERCGTVWGKLTLESPAHLEKVQIVQTPTNHAQTHIAQNYLSRDKVTGIFFTPQIYTHNFQSQARVIGDGIDESSAHTPWANGLRDN